MNYIYAVPLYLGDERLKTLPYLDVTLEDDPKLWDDCNVTQAFSGMKAPTRLGTWHCKKLWISRKAGLQGIEYMDYDDKLKDFCSSYYAPPSQPSAKRTYRTTGVDDMADLSLRFMGVGTDRLRHTMERSRGLSPATKKKGEGVTVVPPLNFPQGKWKAGKTPRLTKKKV